MAKKPIQIRAADLTVDQIADLAEWWNATNTDVIQEAVSRAWHIEATRRNEYHGVPWVVRPGPIFFENETAAIQWLDKRARRIGASEWQVDDDLFYDLEPLSFTPPAESLCDSCTVHDCVTPEHQSDIVECSDYRPPILNC